MGHGNSYIHCIFVHISASIRVQQEKDTPQPNPVRSHTKKPPSGGQQHRIKTVPTDRVNDPGHIRCKQTSRHDNNETTTCKHRTYPDLFAGHGNRVFVNQRSRPVALLSFAVWISADDVLQNHLLLWSCRRFRRVASVGLRSTADVLQSGLSAFWFLLLPVSRDMSATLRSRLSERCHDDPSRIQAKNVLR